MGLERPLHSFYTLTPNRLITWDNVIYIYTVNGVLESTYNTHAVWYKYMQYALTRILFYFLARARGTLIYNRRIIEHQCSITSFI